MKSFFTPLFLLICIASHSQWSNTSNDFYDTLHMPVCTELREQTNTLVVRSYPDSGYIFIWQDLRNTANGYDIYAQKLDKNGNTLWTTGGIPVITGPADQVFKWASNADYRNYSKACTDSANGFYIAAHDYNASGNGNRVVVQHIKADGSMVFGNTGYVVAEGTPSTYQYAFPTLIADGKKGFFIAYMRQLLGGADVIAYCMRDDNGVMTNFGGGQMDMHGENRQEGSPCGIRNYIANPDIYVTDFYIYPDLQGGCNVLMNMIRNSGGNERTFIGYNRLCRVKKNCTTTRFRRTSDIATFDPVVSNYQKDDVVQLFNYSTYFNTVTCRDINDNLHVVTSFYVENLGNGYATLTEPVYNSSYVRGVILPTDGNINAEVITASERDLFNNTTPGNYYVHAYYRYNEIYDSLPYQLCSNPDFPMAAIRPFPPAGVVFDKINVGQDTLIASSVYEYDYCLKSTGNRLLATQLQYIPTTGEKKVILQQMKVQRISADSFAVVYATNDKKGVTIGKEIFTGFGGNSISYDYPQIATDNAGNAMFYIREYYRYVRVSPIGNGGSLLWGSMGKPIGAGVYRNSFMQPDFPFTVINPDGTGVIGWHDNRFLNTDGSNNIWARRLDGLNSFTYLPPVKKTVVLPLLTSTPANPEIMTGLSHQYTTFNTYNSTTGSVSPVVEVLDDYNLGAVNVSTYQHNGPSRLFSGKPYLQRNYKISVENNPAGAANIHVRLYFTQTDFDAMKAADPTILTPGNLQVIKQEDATAAYAPSTYTPVTGETILSPVDWKPVDGGYYIEIVVNSFSNFFIMKSQGALPVTWINVQAQWVNDTKANISWQIGNQLNVKDYVVQRSTDGVHYTNTCTVLAKNTTQYSCVVDADNASKYYFRVLQTDEDGRSSISKVVTLEKMFGKSSLTISPNPFINGNAVLSYTIGISKITQLVLVNSSGAVIWKRPVSLSGSGTFNLPLQTLATGIYGLQVLQNDSWQTIKIMKQ